MYGKCVEIVGEALDVIQTSRVGRFKSAWFKSLILITIRITWFSLKKSLIKIKKEKRIFFTKKTIINYRNHWQNVKIIISVHLGAPDPRLCSFTANVLRDVTLDILGDFFFETFVVNSGKLWSPRITERAVQWIVYIFFHLMTMFWGLGRPLKKKVFWNIHWKCKKIKKIWFKS